MRKTANFCGSSNFKVCKIDLVYIMQMKGSHMWRYETVFVCIQQVCLIVELCGECDANTALYNVFSVNVRK